MSGLYDCPHCGCHIEALVPEGEQMAVSADRANWLRDEAIKRKDQLAQVSGRDLLDLLNDREALLRKNRYLREDMEAARAAAIVANEVCDEALDDLRILREVRAPGGCQCSDDEACKFVRERDAELAHVGRLRDRLKLAKKAMIGSARDWSMNAADAWLWGVIVGWDDASLVALRGRHHWTSADVEQLKAMRVEEE